MKKARILLASAALLAVVMSSVAFKVKDKVGTIRIYTTTIEGNVPTGSIFPATVTASGQPGVAAWYTTVATDPALTFGTITTLN